MPDTSEYVIHIPKFDGDDPPNWKAGNYLAVLDTDNNDNFNQLSSRPQWDSGLVYKIRSEALATPSANPSAHY